MTPLLIGMTGPKRSGKDTFAARLVEKHGFRRIAFADALKAALIGLDPLVRVEYDEVGPLAAAAGAQVYHGGQVYRLADMVALVGMDAVKETREGRRLLQRLGDDAMRQNVSETIWLDKVNGDIVDALASGESVVVTDVRFPNELDLVASLGGFHVTVERPGIDVSDTHASETSIDYSLADVTVYNSGTVSALHALADRTVVNLTAYQEARS